MRRGRRALPAGERLRLSESIARHASRALARSRATRIACYLANDGEADLAPLVERLWAIGRDVFLPVLHGPRLWFLPYDAGTELALNRYRIPEPDRPPRERVAPFALDWAMMPLVAFDAAGHRLGMGGGYYDRTFAYRRGRAWRKPLLVGVAYELQRVPALTPEPWDVALDAIVTERGWHPCR